MGFGAVLEESSPRAGCRFFWKETFLGVGSGAVRGLCSKYGLGVVSLRGVCAKSHFGVNDAGYWVPY
jgi:hypothetical protein